MLLNLLNKLTGKFQNATGRQLGDQFALDVNLASTVAGEDQTHDVLVVEQGQFGYETVTASQTAQVLGAAGAVGDYLDKIVIIPATTSPGNVILLDDTTSITLFVGGASSVADLKPITVPVNMSSQAGAFKITTGANVGVLAVGRFT